MLINLWKSWWQFCKLLAEVNSKEAIDLPMSALEEFCQCWQIQELAVFGSGLRDDFYSSPGDAIDSLRASTEVYSYNIL